MIPLSYSYEFIRVSVMGYCCDSGIGPGCRVIFIGSFSNTMPVSAAAVAVTAATTVVREWCYCILYTTRIHTGL